MIINRKFSITLLLAVPITIAAASSIRQPETDKYINLKVLPKDISPKDLNKIMVDDFEDGLGVACSFCHSADKNNGQIDFISDAKPEKEIARQMIKMTLGINKKYFKIKHPLLGGEALTVTCNTCHKGAAFPDGK